MKRVLVVEDQLDVQQLYREALEDAGFSVSTASDGEEAINKTVKDKPDLILLDLMLPKASGFEVLDVIRNTPETKQTKVIVLSALSENQHIENVKSLGGDLYLVKSQVTLPEVVDQVRVFTGTMPKV